MFLPKNNTILGLRFILVVLLVCSCTITKAQVDIKNSLPELVAKFKRSSNDAEKIKYALTISNFYLNNRAPSQENITAATNYLLTAEEISRKIGYVKGGEDASVIKLQILLLQNRNTEAFAIARRSSGNLYCRLQIAIGKFFLEKGGEDKADLDIADSALTAAQRYADAHRMPQLSLTCLSYRYPLAIEQYRKPEICETLFALLIQRCKKLKATNLEVKAWYTRASNAEADSVKKVDFEKGMALAYTMKDTGAAATMLKEIADCNLRMNNMQLAEKQLKSAIKLYTAAGYKNLFYAYDLLTAIYLSKGDLEAAMRSGLAAVRFAESTGTEKDINYIQYRLAVLCKEMGLKKESLMWARKSLNATVKVYNKFPYLVYRDIAKDLISKGKARVVLREVVYSAKNYPSEEVTRIYIYVIKADCYLALHKPLLAEKFYLQAIRIFEETNSYPSYYYMTCNEVAEFYVGQKLFDKAMYYLNKVFDHNKLLFSGTELAKAHQIQFKVDSAKGRFLSAIGHYQQAKAINDSIFNHVKLKQAEQLQLQFETARREHDYLLLQNRNNIQESKLKEEGFQRKLTTLALVGSVAFLVTMLYLYRTKQKSNFKLQLRQNEINEQNGQLNKLVNEKEWLMKEIHHRVKNNLQIISSLLNTQISYLDNEIAVTAIRDSQNRMQAISIVHQKLYQSEDLASVSLKKYIEELAQNIKDSFHNASRVRFVFNIYELRLNTADIVPLGLILNEAITNCIKYAFDGENKALISISLLESTPSVYRLAVSDNGKGLPKNFDLANTATLGINLMIGLAGQLNGNFHISSAEGTTVTVTFKPSPPELG